MSPDRTLVGVDGCRAGWIAAVERAGAAGIEIAVFPAFEVLLASLDAQAIVAVDMPIGLPERIEGPGRAAEQAARPHLGSRRSSVFSIPGRAAVESFPFMFEDELHRREAHARASAMARRLSEPSRGVSIQAFMLFGKILEIDRLLRADPALADRVIESHPEMAFRVLNGGHPAQRPKKVRNRASPEGLDERQALLEGAGLPAALMGRPPTGAGRDDLLDALALLTTARRYSRGAASAYPDPPGRDAHGLPVAIWA